MTWLAPSRVLVVAGSACVVLGGLVAAITGPLALGHGSWLAAYLVLVCGVAQQAIGIVHRGVLAPPLGAAQGWAVVGCWNLANLAVVLGTLTRVPLLVDLGSLLLIAALLIAWRAARPVAPQRALALALAYRGLLLVLAASVPVGVVLAHVRAS